MQHQLSSIMVNDGLDIKEDEKVIRLILLLVSAPWYWATSANYVIELMQTVIFYADSYDGRKRWNIKYFSPKTIGPFLVHLKQQKRD